MKFVGAEWSESVAETCKRGDHQLVYVTTLNSTNVGLRTSDFYARLSTETLEPMQ